METTSERLHRPVMLRECLDYLQVRPGGRYLDATFGEGGHTEAMLKAGAAKVVALDRDVSALEIYLREGRYRHDPRLELRHGRMSELEGEGGFDGALADLGVSTKQLLLAERGFSFQAAGPVDMRMDPTRDEPLLEKLRHVHPETLADALWENTGLKSSRKIAEKLVTAARHGRLTSTLDVAEISGPKRGPRHPATELFLALRMWVNDELEEVREGLPRLFASLVPGGRLAVLSFHSSEDRCVKRLFKWLCGKCVCAAQPCRCPRVEAAREVTRKPVPPSDDELRRNPRSRSAKLRCIEKTMPATV